MVPYAVSGWSARTLVSATADSVTAAAGAGAGLGVEGAVADVSTTRRGAEPVSRERRLRELDAVLVTAMSTTPSPCTREVTSIDAQVPSFVAPDLLTIAPTAGRVRQVTADSDHSPVADRAATPVSEVLLL